MNGTLERYIEEVEAGERPPLDRVGHAATLAQTLSEVADQLVDHFVQAARTAGHSWSEIGEALGVSKQAAQQRFVPPPRAGARFGRYTQRARAVMADAQEQARHLRHNYIGTEHLLLALLAAGGSIAEKALTAEGVSYQETREAVVSRIGEGPEIPGAQIPFTPRAHGALKRAIREAKQLGHNYVGTEHILLAVAKDREGIAAQILDEAGTHTGALVQAVVSLLSNMRGGSDPR